MSDWLKKNQYFKEARIEGLVQQSTHYISTKPPKCMKFLKEAAIRHHLEAG